MNPIPTLPTPTCSNDAIRIPEPFRAALTELVEIGMSVARMVARAAQLEAAEAEAAAAELATEVTLPLARSLAEAIEADRAAVAASAARATIVARVEAVAGTFAQVSRAIRRTVLLAERLDQGWARRSGADDRRDDRRAMAKRQIARGVADAIADEADGARAERLTEALADRLESLDTLDAIGNRPAEEIIRDICRDLGVDPVRMRLRAGSDETAPVVETSLPVARLHGGAGRPDSRASPTRFPAPSPSGRGPG